MKGFIIALIAILGLAIPILASDLYWQWIPFLSHTEEYPIKLSALFMSISAFITLVLAYTAVKTIEESNKREQRQREEHRKSENRDREERYLNEIIDWLKELEIRVFEPPKGTLRQEMLEDKELQDKLGLTPENWVIFTALDEALKESGSLEPEIKEGKYCEKLATSLQNGVDLGIAVTTILEHLTNRRQMILENSTGAHAPLTTDTIKDRVENEWPLIFELIKNDTISLDDIKLSEEGLRMVRLARNAGSLKKSIGEAIEKAIGLKSSLINS